MANIFHKQPQFTYVSDLVTASHRDRQHPNGSFQLRWKLNSGGDIESTEKIQRYKLYRYLDTSFPVDRYVNIRDRSYQDNFILIKTFDSATTSYTDALNDLRIHFSEPQNISDSDYQRLLDDIFKTRRRIYYKIEAEYNEAIFGRSPLLFISCTDGVEARSNYQQVINNVLYDEGEIVWYFTTPNQKPIYRVAVDLEVDIPSNRNYNVWASGDSQVYCLNGYTGTIIKTIVLPANVGKIEALGVDPTDGTAVCTGKSQDLWKCSHITGQYNRITDKQLDSQKVGLVVTKENQKLYAYVINNDDHVRKHALDSDSINVYPRTNFGCTAETKPNIPNVLGITKGADQGVWVNGHTPIKYAHVTGTVTTVTAWKRSDCCPLADACGLYADANGNLPSFVTEWRRTGAFGHSKRNIVAKCTDEHRTTTTINTRKTVIYNFLQDVGYIYGITQGINLSASNSESYPYSSGSHYKPFTTIYNRQGWLGKSPDNAGDTFGRPYTVQNNPPNPATTPQPGRSQLGVATTIPDDLSLNGIGKTYEIYQTNRSENKIHRLQWNGRGYSTTNKYYIDYNYQSPVQNRDWWTVSQPTHCAVDFQNNIWTISTDPYGILTIMYRMVDTKDFPYGGRCTYPLSGDSSYVYGGHFNDPDIEYCLTHCPTDLLLNHSSGHGKVLSGSIEQQRNTAITWNSENSQVPGKRVYPKYISQWGTANISGGAATATGEYNSDNFGLLNTFTKGYVQTEADFIHPAPVAPQATLRILSAESRTTNCDPLDFWNDQSIVTETFTCSGYDDLKVSFQVDIINETSFERQNTIFFFGDNEQDRNNQQYNVTSVFVSGVSTHHTYQDPSVNGKPDNRISGYPGTISGHYEASANCFFNANIYRLYGTPITGAVFDPSDGIDMNTCYVYVFERWPTAHFYATPYDTASLRDTTLITWELEESNYPVGTN